MSIWHWLIVLSVVILVFGTHNLRITVGRDVERAIRNFKEIVLHSRNFNFWAGLVFVVLLFMIAIAARTAAR